MSGELFGSSVPTWWIERGPLGAAKFSLDRRHRYWLTRDWGRGSRMAVIGLNPSTADAHRDDPTAKRCMRFAEREGYGGLLMLNAYAYRSTDPSGLGECEDPVGPLNDAVTAESCRGARVLVAWGVHGHRRGPEVLDILEGVGAQVLCLGRTKAGHPKHPLYLSSDTPMEAYPLGVDS